MSRSFGSPTQRSCGRAALLAGPFIALAFLACNARSIFSAAYAQALESVQHVVITHNKSITLTTPAPISSVQVDAPDIVSARAITDRRVYIQGKNIGTTMVSVYDQNLQLMKIIDIEVALDTANLQSKIRAATSNKGIFVSNDNGQIVLSGVASDAAAADRAYKLAEAWGPFCGKRLPDASSVGGGGAATGGNPIPCTIVNAMTVASPQQVMLKVRFLEVDRNAGRQLGINWAAVNSTGKGVVTGNGGVTATSTAQAQSLSCAFNANSNTGNSQCSPAGTGIFQAAGTLLGTGVGAPFGTVLAEVVNKGVSIDTLITALETKGLLQRLAEPNLIALSGETASFLAGGQYPVPSPTSALQAPTITYEPYGVQLQFRPTVLNNGIINVSIKPTVSELDFTNAVTISGTTVPALTERTATTTVELRDGQSFAIAGLLEADNQRDISQLPWLGTVPVLGTLFRSSSYQKDQTDLVIIVTPSLVQPAAPGARLATPFDNTVPSIDFFLLGQTEQRKKYTDYVATGGDIKGPYGYMLGVMQEPDPPSSQK
jgi:pilus assembly protein CpaC